MFAMTFNILKNNPDYLPLVSQPSNRRPSNLKTPLGVQFWLSDRALLVFLKLNVRKQIKKDLDALIQRLSEQNRTDSATLRRCLNPVCTKSRRSNSHWPLCPTCQRGFCPSCSRTMSITDHSPCFVSFTEDQTLPSNNELLTTQLGLSPLDELHREASGSLFDILETDEFYEQPSVQAEIPGDTLSQDLQDLTQEITELQQSLSEFNSNLTNHSAEHDESAAHISAPPTQLDALSTPPPLTLGRGPCPGCGSTRELFHCTQGHPRCRLCKLNCTSCSSRIRRPRRRD